MPSPWNRFKRETDGKDLQWDGERRGDQLFAINGELQLGVSRFRRDEEENVKNEKERRKRSI
jgi:hypothetical protein